MKKTVELIRRLNVVEEIRNYPAEIRPGFRTNNRCFIENYKLNSKQTIESLRGNYKLNSKQTIFRKEYKLGLKANNRQWADEKFLPET